MRISKVYCDRCGNEIEGVYIKMVPHFIPENKHGDLLQGDFRGLPELCLRCLPEIFPAMKWAGKIREDEAELNTPGSSSEEPGIQALDWAGAVERMRVNR